MNFKTLITTSLKCSSEKFLKYAPCRFSKMNYTYFSKSLIDMFCILKIYSHIVYTIRIIIKNEGSMHVYNLFKINRIHNML